MDIRDTISMKNKEKMTANTVWQWRIRCVKKYSKCIEPFHNCSKIGLDLNVGSKTHQKLDLKLVTNGVILEICDFAKMVNKSKTYFIVNILENNFDLGLENEQKRIDFTTQILHKVKDLMKKPPKDKHEFSQVFSLFDTSRRIGNSKNGPNMTSAEHRTDCFLVEMNDCNDSEDKDEWWSPVLSTTDKKTEEMDGPHFDDCDHEQCLGPHSVKEVKEDVPLPSFPYCEEIGFSLEVGSKQSLDPSLLTKGVMLEVVHFVRLLTSYSPIVLGVLEHNFELNVKSEHGKSIVWFKVIDLLKRREQLITMLKNESFSFYTDPCKRGSAQLNVMAERRQSKKRALSAHTSEGVKRRKSERSEQEEINTVFHPTDLCTSETAESKKLYTCPLDSDRVSDSEFDLSYTCPLDSDELSGSECAENQNRLLNSTSDILRESESIPLGIQTPFCTNTDGLFSLPVVNSDVNPSLASHPDKRKLSGDEEQSQIPGNVLRECLVKQEEMETESNLWQVRANRVKQILLEDQEYDAFPKSRKVGLEFNVGFGSEQNISIKSLTNAVLLEVAKFALAINSSQQEFIMEILEYNFDLGLQSEKQRKTFACEIMNKIRQLKTSDRFSREIFELPGLVSSVNTAEHNMDSASLDPSSIARMKECYVRLTHHPNAHSEAKERSIDLYPFCKEIGLKLHVNNSQPNKKLKINKLTNGVMTEVTNFAERLCGTFEEICLDIIRHNFDLDSQSGDSHLATDILARLPIAMERKNLTTCLTYSKKVKLRLPMKDNWNFHTDCAQAPFIDQKVEISTDTTQENELAVCLWTLRANRIQQILSVPHVENCPLYSYSKCKKIGIDFNVGSGVKQNLDPKLLTNGIMVEIETFATALQSAQKDFVTEILEYNFDLDLKNELSRTVFAQKLFKRVILAKFRRRGSLMKMPFEFPDLTSLEESPYPKFKYCPKCYQHRNSKLCQDESDPGCMRHPHSHAKTGTVSGNADCTAQKPASHTSSAFPRAEKTFMCSYPYCRKVGIRLCVERDQPKAKLNTRILTRGIIYELASFAKKLCGTKYSIVSDIVKHNFNLGMKSRDINPGAQFFRTLSQINKGPSWFSEIFVVQPLSRRCSGDGKTGGSEETSTKTKQENGVLATTKRVSTRRRKEQSEEEKINTVSHHTNLCISQTTDGDHSYMCPLDSDEASDSECAVNQDPLRNPAGSDVPADSEFGNPGKHFTTTDNSSSLPTEHSNANPPFASQAENRELCGDEEQTQIPRNVPNDCFVELEEAEMESNMWKLRARRVNQILFFFDKECCGFQKYKAFCLDFNVGFGQKQNISVESLTNAILLEVATFALAMNSSQQEFIMEILEYNFDLGLQSEIQRNTFACEIMNKVRQLKNSKDSVKVTRELFELPGHVSSVNLANRGMDSVGPELSNISRMNVCDVAPVYLPDSLAEAKEHSADPYPFCKEIGLKLHANYRQPEKKLEVSKLTNGVMTEVTNFAERLCGTFEEICLDIIRHNFDLDSQNGEPDIAKKILAEIPFVLAQKNLYACVKAAKKMKNKFSMTWKLDFQNNSDLDVHSTGCSQPPIADQKVGPPIADQKVGPPINSEHENDLDSWLWKWRTNEIQQILSVPHVENCPLYSYSRCKKIGINFNVGSGVKQNLDPKLLTNGVMVEVYTFATVLQSAQRHFIIEILEYNFDLGLKNELYRNVFTQQLLRKLKTILVRRRKSLMKMPVELPDSRCIDESAYPKFKNCPKCYQVRNYKLCHDESDPDCMRHPLPHAKTDTVSTEAACEAQKPVTHLSSASPMTEETMGSYPCCKKIGLSLCVDKDRPKKKLDTCVLTREIMIEVANFAKKLCGTKCKIINDVLKYNFNFGIQDQELNLTAQFESIITTNDGGPTWFNQVFVVQPYPQRAPVDGSKWKVVSAIQTRERKEAVKNRQLALQTKKESLTLSSVIKPKTNKKSTGDCYPLCKKIGLDLDVTSKSVDKVKLDLKLLTTAVVMEIYQFAVKKPGHHFSGVVYDILEYNFDLSSQHHRRWEFAFSIASKVKTMVKSYRGNRNQRDKVFKLPFDFKRKSSETLAQKRQDKKVCKLSLEEQVNTTTKDTFVQPVRYHHGMKPWCDAEAKALTGPGNWSPVDAGCDSLQGKSQTKEGVFDPQDGDMKPQQNYVIKYPRCEDHVKYLGDTARFVGYAFLTTRQNSESNMQISSNAEPVQYSLPAEPQVSKGCSTHAVRPNADSGVKNESDTKGVEDVVTFEMSGTQTSSVFQDKESTLIKEEQENVPVESYQYEVDSNTGSEVDIKQE